MRSMSVVTSHQFCAENAAGTIRSYDELASLQSKGTPDCSIQNTALLSYSQGFTHSCVA